MYQVHTKTNSSTFSNTSMKSVLCFIILSLSALMNTIHGNELAMKITTDISK